MHGTSKNAFFEFSHIGDRANTQNEIFNMKQNLKNVFLTVCSSVTKAITSTSEWLKMEPYFKICFFYCESFFLFMISIPKN